jgi:hypothetical protein
MIDFSTVMGDPSAVRGDIGAVREDSGAVRGGSGAVRGDPGAVRGDFGAVMGDPGAVRGKSLRRPSITQYFHYFIDFRSNSIDFVNSSKRTCVFHMIVAYVYVRGHEKYFPNVFYYENMKIR